IPAIFAPAVFTPDFHAMLHRSQMDRGGRAYYPCASAASIVSLPSRARLRAAFQMKYHKPHALTFTPPVRGRGALHNPAGRFEDKRLETDAETFDALLEAEADTAQKQIPTEVFQDASRT